MTRCAITVRLDAWRDGSREPQERLCRAALDLYLERGFDDVTVAEITERAGLTRRTFFRYFTDKREVLFGGAAQLPGIVTARSARSTRDPRPSRSCWRRSGPSAP